MRPPHLLRVDEGPERFAALLAALAAAGLRAGWLELGAAEPAAASLESAAAFGARRAVAAGSGRSVAVKALRGEPVLRDLLREHFPGCALVLVRVRGGETPAPEGVPLAPAPALFPSGDGWRIALAADAAAQQFDTPGLLAALRRPRPWDRE
ncbi:MAG TPA: hypothetical protein VJA16_24475 [Thermoanaerobaculia bacterium]